MESYDCEQRNRASWDANAAAWTTAVREQLIASRRAGTDAADLRACLRLQPRCVLDVGCGEGWLARALVEHGINVVGIDASEPLIAAARNAGGANYEVAPYESLVGSAALFSGPWDTIVCNFSLFGDPLAPLLAALAARLANAGRLLIQTVHPWTAAGNGPYVSGWREETFADFDVDFPAAMPWYFRTLESWHVEIQQAALAIARIEEPIDSATERPLSLLIECSRDA